MSDQWVASLATLIQTLHYQRVESGSYVCPLDPGEPGYKLKRISITGEEGAILASLAADKVVLEIGTGLGISTHYLASRARCVSTVDIDTWVQYNVWPVLDHLPNVCCVPDIPQAYCDMVFIDGCHFPASVLADMERAKAVLNPGGMLVFHDVNSSQVRGVAECERQLDRFYPTMHGIGVLQL